jgi:sulfatase-like protein
MTVTDLEQSVRAEEPAVSRRRRDRGGLARAVVQLAALSFAPVLSFWSSNIARFMNVGSLLFVGSAALAFGVLALALLVRLRIQLARAVAVSSVLLLALHYWQTLGFSPNTPLDMPGVNYALAGVVVLILIVQAYRYGDRQVFRVVAFVVALTMATTSAGQLVLRWQGLKAAALPQERLVAAASPLAPLPNIYYIVPDGYGRADVLSSLYGFNNRRFLDRLREHGFYVAPRSTSNYSLTIGSIPSTLSMQYVLPPRTAVRDDEEYALHAMLHGDNSVVRSLKAAGYRYTQIESGWSATQCGSLVDECLHQSWFDDAKLQLFQELAIAPVLRRTLYASLANENLTRFDRLEKVARERSRGPKFVFSHVLLPHPPLFVDGKCRIVPDSRMAGTALGGGVGPDRLPLRKSAYIDQVECANRRLTNFLAVLDRVDPNSIVIIQADHGPDSRGQLFHAVRTWGQEDYFERFSPLAAYRLPEHCHSMLHADIAAVNVFRVVLNCALGTKLPMLPTRHFAFRIQEPTLEVRF